MLFSLGTPMNFTHLAAAERNIDAVYAGLLAVSNALIALQNNLHNITADAEASCSVAALEPDGHPATEWRTRRKELDRRQAVLEETMVAIKKALKPAHAEDLGGALKAYREALKEFEDWKVML